MHSQEVIGSQGESYANGSGSIDFTIGETIVFTGTDGTNNVTQGFHQTNWNFVGLVNHTPNFNVTVFPNPMDQNLTIQTEDFDGVVYRLYDAQGKVVAESEMETTSSIIVVDSFAPGAYNLVLIKQNQKLKTFKLIKQQ